MGAHVASTMGLPRFLISCSFLPGVLVDRFTHYKKGTKSRTHQKTEYSTYHTSRVELEPESSYLVVRRWGKHGTARRFSERYFFVIRRGKSTVTGEFGTCQGTRQTTSGAELMRIEPMIERRSIVMRPQMHRSEK